MEKLVLETPTDLPTDLPADLMEEVRPYHHRLQEALGIPPCWSGQMVQEEMA